MKMDNIIAKERLHNALILIVDDVETNRTMLLRSLNNRDYNNIFIAKDGAEALQMTRDLKPDLVILDLVMPGMDGFSYLQAIRHDPAFDNMPIFVQTILEDIQDKLKAFHLGASDYVCKPIDPDELSARVQVHLMKKLLVEDMHNYQLRTEAEIQSAKSMQERLMPNEQGIAMCERVFDMKISGYVENSSLLGGDCWGMRPLSDKKLALYNYDFAGHGVSAAINVFRIHTVMQECAHAAGDPGNFLSQLNKCLYPLLERNQFATMFYGIVDTEANCLLYATAATLSFILFGHAEQHCTLMDGRGFPIGAINNAVYETQYAAFMPEDLAFFFSDCLIETPNHSGEVLSEQIIADCVLSAMHDHYAHPARHAVDAVLAKFRNHHGAPINDDLTINAFWRHKK